MTLNVEDWSKAQELLLQLVQVLTPLTEGKSEPVSLFLNQRFYIPPAKPSSSSIRNPVKILSTLQKEVEELIREMPEEKQEEPATKVTAKAPEKSQTETHRPQLNTPLSRQAKILVDQVHKAIGTLCNSTHMKSKSQEPLRQSLNHLKPYLDQVIETMTVVNETPEKSRPQNRYPVPHSSREELIKKLFSRPEQPLKEEKKEVRGEEVLISKKAPNKPLTPQVAERTVPQQQQDVKIDLHEKTILIAAPFVPDTRTITPARKKKKRKGFWFREEEEHLDNRP